MAGFEVVVRPVVLPDIRPKPAQTLPPADDPEKGWCTIQGNPANEVTTSNSFSTSVSKSINVETERTVDTVRVYQENDDGSINKDNFVDVEAATRIKLRGGAMPAVAVAQVADPAPMPSEANRKRLHTLQDNWYAKQQEGRNIRILKENEIKRNKEAQEAAEGED